MPFALILGATKGLGLELANGCQALGWQTARVGSSIPKISRDGSALNLPCDLSSESAVHDFLSVLEKEAVTVDHFFWISGRLLKGAFESQAPEEIRRTLDINFRNAVSVAHWVWSKMSESKAPKTFTTVSSSSGIKPRRHEAIYVASKFAQVGFTESLALENENPNVRLSLFLPGGMKTPFWKDNPTSDFGSFLDPQNVADFILKQVTEQDVPFIRVEIPRGSL